MTQHPFLHVTCHWAPVQVEGTAPDGRDIYFRFRHGRASFMVDEQTVWSAQLSDDLDGRLEEALALRLAGALTDLHGALKEVRDTRIPVDPEAMRKGMEHFFGLTPPAQT